MNKTVSVLVMMALLVSGCSSMPSWLGGGSSKKEKLAGDRIAVLPINTQLEPDKTLAAKPMSLPPAIANADWPQHTGSVTSQTANLAGGAFTNISHASAGNGSSFDHVLIPRPVVAGGAVFAMDAVGNVSAHDMNDVGHVLWQSDGVSEEDSPQVMGGGLAWDQGKLYAVSGRGVVAAMDVATGKVLWKKALRIPFRSAPKVAGGKLFAVSIDNQLYAISAENGDILWTQRGINETAGLMNSISPVTTGDAVIVPFSSGEIYGLAASDGHGVWSETLGGSAHTQASASFSGIGGDPVVDGAVVFAVSSGEQMSAMSVATGQHLWDKRVGSFNTPWLAGNVLFVLSTDNTLAALDKFTGEVYWATQLQSFLDMEEKREPITWRGPVLVDGRLSVVGSNGELLLVSATDGKIMNTISVSENIFTPPVVAGGKMYLIAQDATLYELQ